jgi:hypothetical protein
MPWYRDGTISVTLNSSTVTGAATRWISQARVGDGLIGPDGRVYEVVNIASDTSLKIDPPYKSATAAAQPYAISPIQGYVRTLADQAARILNEVGPTLNGKVDKVEGMGLSANDYTTTEKQKLAGVEVGAIDARKFGIGTNAAPAAGQLNSTRAGGSYHITAAEAAAAGLPLNLIHAVLQMPANAAGNAVQLAAGISSSEANNRMFMRKSQNGNFTSTREFAFLEAANTWTAGQIFNKIGVGGSSTSGALIASNSKNLQANINFSVLDINNGADDGVFTAGRTHRAAYTRMDGNITEAQRGSNPYTLIGAEPVARASSNDNAAGEVTTLYGVRSYATDNSVRSSILDVSAGIRASSDHTGTTSPKSVNGSYGAHLAVNVNATTTVREALGCFAQVNSAGTVQDGHLFRGVYSGGGSYANKWGLHISGATQNHLEGTLNVTGAVTAGPVRVGQYTLQTLPSASAFNGYEIDVTNATGGSKRCRSNGSVWQIINTNTTVS